MMENQPDAGCNTVLQGFTRSHQLGFDSTGNTEYSLSVVRLETRHAEVLGKMQRFRDQGEVLCGVADYLLVLGKQQEAEGYFQRARKIGETHD